MITDFDYCIYCIHYTVLENWKRKTVMVHTWSEVVPTLEQRRFCQCGILIDVGITSSSKMMYVVVTAMHTQQQHIPYASVRISLHSSPSRIFTNVIICKLPVAREWLVLEGNFHVLTTIISLLNLYKKDCVLHPKIMNVTEFDITHHFIKIQLLSPRSSLPFKESLFRGQTYWEELSYTSYYSLTQQQLLLRKD